MNTTIDILTLFKKAHTAKLSSDEFLVLQACSLANRTSEVSISDIKSATGLNRAPTLDIVQRLKNKGYIHHVEFSYQLTSLGASVFQDIQL